MKSISSESRILLFVYLFGAVQALGGESLSIEAGNLVMEKIAEIKPAKWRMELCSTNGKPLYWAKTSVIDYVQIKLIGTDRAGYRYTLRSGEKKDVLFMNEVIDLWLVPQSLDDGWTIKERLKNQLSKTPTEIPDILGQITGYRVYGKASWEKTTPGTQASPPNTISAKFLCPSPEGSWSAWRNDLKRAFEH